MKGLVQANSVAISGKNLDGSSYGVSSEEQSWLSTEGCRFGLRFSALGNHGHLGSRRDIEAGLHDAVIA